MSNTIEIKKIKIGRRFRKDLGDIEHLADSIKTVGLLHPVVIDDEDTLIAGRRRIAAFVFLGRDRIPFHRINIESIVSGEYAENSERKGFTSEETIAILEAVEKTRIGHNPGTKVPPRGIFPKGRTSAVVGKAVGHGHGYIEKLKEIVDEKKKGNKLAARLLDDIDNKGKKVTFALAELRKSKLAEKKPIPDPTGNRDLGYMDYPWEFDVKTRITPKYRTMPLEEGKGMKLALKRDAVLFFWTTMSNIEQSQELLNHWKFEIKSEIIWVKIKKNAAHLQIKTPSMDHKLVDTRLDGGLDTNPGHYARGAHEKLYICTRGNIGTPLYRPDSVIFAPKSAHSRKPAIFKKIIQQMYPHLTKREYFNRGGAGEYDDDTWDYWGDESAKN